MVRRGETDKSQEIRWRSYLVDTIDIDYSPDGGRSWETIATGVDAESRMYSWTPPDGTSWDSLVRITAADDGRLSDTSSGTFNVSGPFVRITYPNEGEKLLAGHDCHFWWQTLAHGTGTISYSMMGAKTGPSLMMRLI